MKKILVIHTKYQIQGGEDIAVNNEVDFLKKHYEVRTIYFSNKIDSYLKQVINFLRNINNESDKLIETEIKSFNPDLIYIHNTWFKGSLGIFKIAKKYKIKVALKLHNFRYDCTRFYLLKNHLSDNEICNACGLESRKGRLFNKYFPDSYLKSFLIIWYGKKYFQILLDDNKTIIVLTEFHKNYLENDIGVTSKVINFPNYLNLNQKHDETNQKKYIVYAGRVSREKGVEELINSYLKINSTEFTLKIIGIGPQLEYLKNKYKQKNVEFLGQKSNNETLKIIYNSIAVVTATKLLEGQPMLLCEASSLGVPSVFPDNGGISEFFPDKYKLKFNQNDYIDLCEKLKYLSNEDLLKKIGIENKNHINKYLQEDRLKKIVESI